MFIIVRRSTLESVHRKLDKIIMTIEERFNAVSAKLDEASTEILAEIAKLRDGTLTPEQEAALANIEAKANALADIAPPVA
jgi:Skp family chaperone for outer membrane proteins